MEHYKIKEEVWQTIQTLNQAWTVKGNVDELKNYFHKDMVAISWNLYCKALGLLRFTRNDNLLLVLIWNKKRLTLEFVDAMIESL